MITSHDRRRRSAVAWLSALAVVAIPATAAGPDTGPAANDRVDAVAAGHFVLDPAPDPGVPMTLTLPIDGSMHAADLRPHSVRAPGYRLRVERDGGMITAVTPAVPRTLRGTLTEVPGSRVAASLLDDGLHGVVLLPDGARFGIEPVAGRTGLHRVHRDGDGPTPPPAAAVGPLFCAELGIDADFEYFLAWGSVEAVEARIDAIVNILNAQFEQDVQISHVITAMIIRTSALADPYTTNDGLMLLQQFRNEWLTNQANVPRDLAHLFTGRNLSGGIIGVSFPGSVCSDLGFSLVQSDALGPVACAASLSGHELGHQWGADDCACPGYTMGGPAECANQFHPELTIPEIIAFRDSLTCLETCGGCPADLTGPAPGDPPDGVIDVFDLLALLANFGDAAGPGVLGDITGPGPGDPPDGVVDVFDLLALLASFGEACPTG